MCNNVQTALEVIKTQSKRVLTKGEIVVLFQQVVSDWIPCLLMKDLDRWTQRP